MAALDRALPLECSRARVRSLLKVKADAFIHVHSALKKLEGDGSEPSVTHGGGLGNLVSGGGS